MMPASPNDPSARQRHELIDWFMRRHGAPWGAEDERAFQHWLQTPANRRMYAQWEADWALIDAMPQGSADRLRAMVAADRIVDQALERALGRAAAIAAPRPPDRRQAMARGLALAGVAGVVGTVAWLGWQHVLTRPVYQQAWRTRKGQQQEVSLPDGSELRLDTATALQVTYFRAHREVRLTQGQALFAVAPDAGRPFVVRAGSTMVTVVGTRFSVRLTPEVPGREGVEVSVEEGRVRVGRAEAGPPARWVGTDAAGAFELTAGQRLVFTADGSAPVLGQVPAAGVAAWRAMPLSFSDVPLQEALAEMGRYADLGIASVDPSVAGLRLSGTFDPRHASVTRRLLANALPIRLAPGERGFDVKPQR